MRNGVLAVIIVGMDFQTARHLLQRTGFGGTPAAIRRITGKDHVSTAQIFVDTVDTGADAALPEWVDARVRLGGAADRGQLDGLGSWWLERMRRAKSPLGERLVLFWHMHFGAAAPDVPAALRGRQHRTLRKHAAGNYRALLTAMVSDPALLIALGQATASRKSPSTLFAKALLDRFALGPGQYDPADVEAASAAFTGWQVDRAGNQKFVGRAHDGGKKTFLARTGRHGPLDILRILLEDDRTAEHVARSLWLHFVSPTPDPAEISRLGAVLRDADYELKPLLAALFTSQAMVEAGHHGVLIKTPVELIVGAARVLYLDTDGADLTWACASAGVRLFEAPVEGWATGIPSLTTASLERRCAALGRLLRVFESDARTPLGGGRALATWLGQPALDIARARTQATRVLLPFAPVAAPPEWFTSRDVVRTLVLDPTFQLA